MSPFTRSTSPTPGPHTLRPRSWPPLGSTAGRLPGRGAVRPLGAEPDLWQLIEDLATYEPIEMLAFAATSIVQAGPLEPEVRRGLLGVGYFEASLLAKSMAWLVDRTPPESLIDPDTPEWLLGLDRTVVSAARRRPDAEGMSYLLEVTFVDGQRGTIQARVAPDGALCNSFSMTDDIESAVDLLSVVSRCAPSTWRTIRPTTALRALRQARDIFDDLDSAGQAATAGEPLNPWPRNRALLDFTLDHFAAAR